MRETFLLCGRVYALSTYSVLSPYPQCRRLTVSNALIKRCRNCYKTSKDSVLMDESCAVTHGSCAARAIAPSELIFQVASIAINTVPVPFCPLRKMRRQISTWFLLINITVPSQGCGGSACSKAKGIHMACVTSLYQSKDCGRRSSLRWHSRWIMSTQSLPVAGARRALSLPSRRMLRLLALRISFLLGMAPCGRS